jgi:hypothetical protein
MTNNVRMPQSVNAYWNAEGTYGTPAADGLNHTGSLDTFDPRMLDRQYTPINSIGQSTSPHILSGPIKITCPIKLGLHGSAWRNFFTRGMGISSINGTNIGQKLTSTINSLSILADEKIGSNYQATLVSGVAFNGIDLEADLTTGTLATLNCDTTAFWSEEGPSGASTLAAARNFSATGFERSNYSSIASGSVPTTSPATGQDITVKYGSQGGNLATTLDKGLKIDGPANSYVEVGEKYMTFWTNNAPATAVDSNGIITLGSGNAASIGDGTSSGATGGLAKMINDASGWACEDTGTSANVVPATRLVKGIYDVSGNGDVSSDPYYIYAVDTLTDVPYLKSFKLSLTNGINSIPQAITKNSTTKFLQHANVFRGSSEVTLDLRTTAKDETFYDALQADLTIPQMRIGITEGGSTYNVVLTNGKIMSRNAPYTAATETPEDLTIKFTGNGTVHDYSSYAISTDWTL